MVDCREPRHFHKSISLYLGDVGWQMLPTADYIIDKPGGSIWIERKAVRDFLSSIGDGRLFRQVKSLVKLSEEAGAKPYLLLEGTWTPVETPKGFLVGTKGKTTGYTVNSFLGALEKVQALGVKLWTSDGIEGTVKLIVSLAGYKTEGK